MKDLFNHEYVKQNKKNPTASERIFYKAIKKANPFLWQGERFNSSCFQYPVLHERGFYIIDFYIDFIKLAFEIDGEIHFKSSQVDYDIKRINYLNSLNIKVISFTNNKIKQLTKRQLIAEIKDNVRARYIEYFKTTKEEKLNKKRLINTHNMVYCSEKNFFLSLKGRKHSVKSRKCRSCL